MLDPQTLGKKLAETATTSDPSDPNAMWLKIATDIIDHLKLDFPGFLIMDL